MAFIERDGIIGSSGLSVLRAKGIEPEYLFAFCKTDYFVKSLLRANKATMYPAVSHKDIQDMPLFVPSSGLRREIAQCVKKSLSYAEQSKDILKAAQSLLLSELGLSNWRPKHQLAFVRQCSEAASARRMDAEYFQPQV